MGAFGKGFAGCFGVLAAIAVAIVALIVAGAMSGRGRDDRVAAGTASAADLLVMCAPAFGVAQDLAPRSLRGAALSSDPPEILAQGPAPTIACGFRNRRGGPGQILAEVTCANPMERSCVAVRRIESGAATVFRATP